VARLHGAFDTLPNERSLRVAVRLLDDGARSMEDGHVWRTADGFFASAPSLTELWWRPEGSHAPGRSAWCRVALAPRACRSTRASAHEFTPSS
jgi:hypothetical protein